MSAAIRSIIRRIGAGDSFNDVTAYPDATLDDWIGDAIIDTPPASRLGTKYDRAVAYYTCHLMLQGGSSVSSTGGGIKKKQAGAVSIEYHQASTSSASQVSDKYLEMYLKLIKINTRPSPMVLNNE